METIAKINKHGVRAKGRPELVKHAKGLRLTRKQSMLAKCYDCMGYYSDGVRDCEMPECPLYPYHSYNSCGG